MWTIALNKINLCPLRILLSGLYHDVVKIITMETSFSCSLPLLESWWQVKTLRRMISISRLEVLLFIPCRNVVQASADDILLSCWLPFVAWTTLIAIINIKYIGYNITSRAYPTILYCFLRSKFVYWNSIHWCNNTCRGIKLNTRMY